MKRIPLLLYAIVFAALPAKAQSAATTLEQCYEQARQNYPQIKASALIDKTAELQLVNATRNFLPQISINGQATYQSDVTSFPIKLPNVNVPEISKDQYKLYGEINQPLTDILIIKQQKQAIQANAEAEKEKTEVDLYKIKERVNQLYFNILLTNNQLAQTLVIRKDLEATLKKTTELVKEGVASPVNKLLLEAELVKLNQRITEMESNRTALIEVLNKFTHQAFTAATEFKEPATGFSNNQINRKELSLFSAQQKNLEIQKKILQTRLVPRVSLFAQGGYGRPALNMLNNDFKTYYLAGARFNWNLSNFYTSQQDKRLIELNQQNLEIQKENFVFNTTLSLKQQDGEISKLQKLINQDYELIALREKLTQAAKSQLENGTITTTDYITYLNSEETAKQNLILHKLQLTMALVNYNTTSGN